MIKDKQYLIYIFLATIAYVGVAFIQSSLDQKNGIYIGVSTLLFIISVIIGFFSQKIQARSEFQENLKTKAYGAIRKLNDIEILANRGLRYLSQEIGKIPEIILLNIIDSVKSAKFDWTDVLENDFKTIQDIEHKKRDLLSVLGHESMDSSEKDGLIKKFKEDIKTLRSILPPVLQDTIEIENFDGENYSACQLLFNNDVTAKKMLEIRIEILDETLPTFLDQKQPLVFYRDNSGSISNMYIILGLATEKKMGKILNKYSEFGIRDDSYYSILYESLDINFSHSLLIVEDYLILNTRSKSERERWIGLPVSKVSLGYG